MEAELPWKTFLVLTAAAIGCTFRPGVLSISDGGENNSYDCNCQCGPSPVTQTYFVAGSTDDAEEYVGSGDINIDSSDLEMTYEDDLPQSQQLVGIRYRNLGIPQGATILSAQIQFTVDEATSAATSLQIQAQASDDAPTFSAATFDLSARPRTSASVPWVPNPWPTLDVAGPDQLTPDLAPVLQELVNRPGWTPASAAALIITGTGWRVAWSWDRLPTNAPRLIVKYQEPAALTVNLSTCVTPELNANLDGGRLPSDSELANDCSGRVQNTLSGLAAACGYPSVCTCTVDAGTQTFAESCDLLCTEVPLAPECANFDPAHGNVTATNADGGEPVCVTHSPLASAIYGQRSRCVVSGTATVQVEDEDTKVTPASGVIEFIGSPCPGQSCAVGMAYAMDMGSVTYSHLFGSATFSDLSSVGGSKAGDEVTLDAAGNGAFVASSLDIGGRGRRDGVASKVVGSNDNPLAVGVVWSGFSPSCEVAGSLVGNADPELKRCENAGANANAICTSDDDCADDPACSDGICNCLPVPETSLALSMNVSGTLVNQPPKANAGADQVVECNVPGGARFDLDSQSQDPDGNLMLTRWYLNSRTGTGVGYAPRSTIQQAVGTSATYVLRVIDALAQADEDQTQVQVVDTTAPTLSCNTPIPATIRPGQHGLRFTATAKDVCDPYATPIVTSYRCEKNDKAHPCKVSLWGDTVTIVNPSGVGTRVSWDVQVSDASGNVTTTTCAVDVAN